MVSRGVRQLTNLALRNVSEFMDGESTPLTCRWASRPNASLRSKSYLRNVPDRDWELRLAAFARLEELTRARGGLVTNADLDAGFVFAGERIRLWDSRR